MEGMFRKPWQVEQYQGSSEEGEVYYRVVAAGGSEVAGYLPLDVANEIVTNSQVLESK